jgi:hypothetical protein
MTTPEDVIRDDPIANEELTFDERRRIVRIRTTAMGAVPQRASFGGLTKPTPDDQDA